MADAGETTGVIDREGQDAVSSARIDSLQEALAELKRFDRQVEAGAEHLGDEADIAAAREVLTNSVKERARMISSSEMARALDRLPEDEGAELAVAWGEAQPDRDADRDRGDERESGRTD
ncbi:MAG: hypothetical protein R3C52_09200 [Hyphomonadaceae bacterium]